MFLWDIRQPNAIAYTFGPIVSGESVDYLDNEIIVGNYRDQDSLEIYDYRMFRKLYTVDF